MKTSYRLTLVILTMIFIVALSGCAGPTGVPSTAGQQGPVGPAGAAGVSITGASVNSSGRLILTLSNGQTIDSGNVIGPQGPASTLIGSAASFSSIIPKIEPSIVRVDVTISGGLSSGSGTIIDNRGYIITNAHVLTGGQNIKVTLKDGTLLNATVISSDANQDLAIIKLTSTRTDFPVMTLGTLSDVVVGESVVAAGFPGGTDLPGPATFTMGIVSAFRNYAGINYIQTDATVNPGSSGGCLFTLSGRMIGVPSSGITPVRQDFEGINLAIPINQVTTFITQYVK